LSRKLGKGKELSNFRLSYFKTVMMDVDDWKWKWHCGEGKGNSECKASIYIELKLVGENPKPHYSHQSFPLMELSLKMLSLRF